MIAIFTRKKKTEKSHIRDVYLVSEDILHFPSISAFSLLHHGRSYPFPFRRRWIQLADDSFGSHPAPPPALRRGQWSKPDVAAASYSAALPINVYFETFFLVAAACGGGPLCEDADIGRLQFGIEISFVPVLDWSFYECLD